MVEEGEEEEEPEQHEVAAGLYEAMKRLLPDPVKRGRAMVQLSDYKMRRGEFSPLKHPEMWASVKSQPAWKWWDAFVRPYAPELAYVAVRVLAASCSTKSTKYSERNWSLFAWIHSKKRNRLSEERANDLVFINSNMRLMRRSKRLAEKMQQDPAIAWRHCASDDGEESDLPEEDADVAGEGGEEVVLVE